MPKLTPTELISEKDSVLATNGANGISAEDLRQVIQSIHDSFLHLDANLDSRYYTEAEVNALLALKQAAITANTAFNKNFGTGAGTVCEGNDSRLSNSRQCNNSFDNAATSRSNLGLGSIATKNYWTGGAAAYAALGSYDSNTLYFVVGP